MTPARLQAIEEIFHAALECDTKELGRFLDEKCGGDETLRREIEALLASHRAAENFIETPVAGVADAILEHDEVDALLGQRIGQYRITELIGAGGMGAVYLAQRADEQYEKSVAIKLIKRGMDTDSVLRHFRNERQILAAFDHPNIAHLFDGGATEDGRPYFVMEYVNGLPITEYCDAHELSISQRLTLFRQVCAAVSYAHRHLVIHRDIKRSNILVSDDGVPKLLDFGIAKILQEGERGQALATFTGLRLMTPEYASPEQLRGDPVTTASDVYSLGVVLYELLTGSFPYRFASRSARDVERAITEQEAKKPSTAISENKQSKIENRNSKMLRGDLDTIVLKALRKEPERRYQSVDQLSEDIRRHLEARPILARRDSLAYRGAKFVQRNKAVTAAAALVLLSLLAGIIATTWQAHRAKTEEMAAKAAKARAERRFNDVRQLAHSVLFDYHDAIKDLPGATRVRERLVKDALNYLDSLSREAGGDFALQRELAAAYERVGDVRGQAYSASLGDRAGALDSYKKALQIRESLLKAAPQDAQSRRDMAATYRKIGNQLLETTEAAQGLENLRRSIALYSAVAAEQPANRDVQRELAVAYNDLGLALEDRGDMAGALQHHQRAAKVREELLAAEPGNLQAQRDLSVSYVNTGRAFYFSADIPRAIEINRKAIELRTRLVEHDPTNADYRRLLAVSYQNDGDYRAQTGDINAALESFRKKIVLDQQALAADPDNVQAQRDYAYSSERIGVLLSQLGNYSQALPHLSENLKIHEKIAARDPTSIDERYIIAVAHGEIACAHAALGNPSQSLEQHREAIRLLEQQRADPTQMNVRGLEAQAYGWLGRAQAALATAQDAATTAEHWRSAREMFRRSLDIWLDLRARGTLAADDVPRLEEAQRELAKCEAALAQ